MDKSTFLATLKSNRAELDAALALVAEVQMEIPGVSGEMSVKDILAHIVWYEREMIGLLEQRALAGSDLWGLPDAERNAIILKNNRDRSLSNVRHEAQQVYQELLHLVEALEDDDLNYPAKFRDMPEDWVPWQLIADNSSDHYLHHAKDIQRWMARSA